MKDKTTAPAGVVSGNEFGYALDAARSALPEFSQQDDYLLAHGASLMSEDSHEILHRDTLRRIVAAAVVAERERCAKLETAIQEALKQARTYPWASGTFILTLEDALTANAKLTCPPRSGNRSNDEH